MDHLLQLILEQLLLFYLPPFTFLNTYKNKQEKTQKPIVDTKEPAVEDTATPQDLLTGNAEVSEIDDSQSSEQLLSAPLEEEKMDERIAPKNGLRDKTKETLISDPRTKTVPLQEEQVDEAEVPLPKPDGLLVDELDETTQASTPKADENLKPSPLIKEDDDA